MSACGPSFFVAMGVLIKKIKGREDKNMNIGQIFYADSANGPGMRVSVFVSGCTNHCPGCFQPETWDFSYGVPYTEETEDKFLAELAKPYYHGLTVLGGEPFEKENQPAVSALVRRVRETLPEKTIWIYTGFTYDRDLVPSGCRYTSCTDQILDAINVLVDGRYMKELKDLSLVFRGSKNQRILDMKWTRKQGQAVFCKLYHKT